jgi:peptide/nickel transport system substrate-binding protein
MHYIIVLASLLLLTACNAPDNAAIRFGLAAAPVNLDPRQATDAASSRINRLLYRGLVDFDAALRPVPDLADWRVRDALELEYELTLRPDRPDFHHQRPLTAHDVKATYDWILHAENASPLRGNLQIIREIEIVDNNTLIFKLNKADLLFPTRLTVGIVPHDLHDHRFTRHPIGNGEFEFIEWQDHSRLTLRRRHDGQLVIFFEVKDPVVRSLKLIHAELDLIQNDLSPELVTWLSQQKSVKVETRAGSNFAYLGFNLQDPLTQQLTVRRAIAHAIDREAIIKYVMGNAADLAHGLLPPHHWAGQTVNHYEYNPELARQLLASLDKSSPLTLSYKTSNNPFRVRVASVIQQQLEAVGLTVSLQTYDWGTFYGDIKQGRFQMFSLAWIGIKTPDIFRYAFHSEAQPPNGANRGRFVDPIVDQFIEQAEQAQQLETQADLYRQLQTYLHEQLPYIPLWYEDHILVYNKRLHGYSLAADGNYDGLKTATLIIPSH